MCHHQFQLSFGVSKPVIDWVFLYNSLKAMNNRQMFRQEGILHSTGTGFIKTISSKV